MKVWEPKQNQQKVKEAENSDPHVTSSSVNSNKILPWLPQTCAAERKQIKIRKYAK